MAYELDRRGFLGLSAAVIGSALLAACGGRPCQHSQQGQQIKAERASITGPSGSPVRGGTLTFSDTEAVPSWQSQDVNVPISVSRTSIVSLGQTFGGPGNTALLASPPELAALYQRELEAKDDAEVKAVQIEQQKALHKDANVIAYFEEAQTFGASPNVHVTFQTQTDPDFCNAWKRAEAKA